MGDLIYLFIAIGIIALVAWFTIYTDKQAAKTRAKRAEHERIAREEQERKERKEHEEHMARVERLLKLGEVKRQAELVGDNEVLSAVLNNTYTGKLPEKTYNGLWTSVFKSLEILKIAGINYRGNLSAYVGDFRGVLIPEPKNDYDPNAIMIKCEDGKHLEYVPEDLTASIRERLGDDFKRHRITGRIDKHEDYDYDADKERDFFTGYINIVYK